MQTAATKIAKAKQLIVIVNQKITQWDEYSQFKLKKVRNLSRSDMDTIILYCEQIIKNGGYGFQGLMDPRGPLKDVLVAFEVMQDEE